MCVRRNPLFSEIFLPFLVSHLISLVFFPSFNEDDEEDEKKIGKPSADEGEEETCHAPFFRGWKNETGGLSHLFPRFPFFKNLNEKRIKPRRSKETVRSCGQAKERDDRPMTVFY